jgi:SNF2 family DNA or RNA helicase
MIRVDKHVHGLSVAADEGIHRSERIQALELHLRASDAFVSSGRLIVPVEGFGIVLESLGLEGVTWDSEVLAAARRNRDHRQMQMRARLEVARALEEPYRLLSGYRRLSQLDPHQVAAVAAISAPSLRGIAVFDEQGTGKTITALAAFEWLREHGRVEKLVVVAPKSVLAAWIGQCHEFLDGSSRTVLVAGSAAERRRALLRPHDILLVGYEAAVASAEMLRVILSARPATYMLVVDESYLVKNPATARARVIARLRAACERALVLCGTPAPNSAIDVVNQIDIADGGVTFGGRRIPKDSQAAYSEVADSLQNAIYLRRLKEDVLPEIPSKQIEKVYLELSARQRAFYDRVRDELILAVQNIDDREFTRQLSTFLVRRVRLLQICSNPSMLDPLYNEVPTKILALDRLLYELVEQQEKKVVIWSCFRKSLDRIEERYNLYGVARIDGTVASIDARLDAINRFQSSPGTRLFIGNAAAAGAGITLTAAHHAIYESLSNQAAHYLQSVDRIHRRGQAEQVVSHILIANDTIEEQEFKTLTRKERAGRELLGDNYNEPMTRERFLAELESNRCKIPLVS